MTTAPDVAANAVNSIPKITRLTSKVCLFLSASIGSGMLGVDATTFIALLYLSVARPVDASWWVNQRGRK